MEVKHYEQFMNEKFEIRGFDTATLSGILGLSSISIQYFLSIFAFQSAIGFIVALNLLLNPFVLGIISLTLSKNSRKSLPIFLGIITLIISSYYYFQELLPLSRTNTSIYILLPAVSIFLISTGLILRYFFRINNDLIEISLISLGAVLIYILYLAIWIDILFLNIFGD